LIIRFDLKNLPKLAKAAGIFNLQLFADEPNHKKISRTIKVSEKPSGIN